MSVHDEELCMRQRVCEGCVYMRLAQRDAVLSDLLKSSPGLPSFQAWSLCPPLPTSPLLPPSLPERKDQARRLTLIWLRPLLLWPCRRNYQEMIPSLKFAGSIGTAGHGRVEASVLHLLFLSTPLLYCLFFSLICICFQSWLHLHQLLKALTAV